MADDSRRTQEKHLFYFNWLPHPTFQETLSTRKDVVVHRLDTGGPDRSMDAVFARAHAYQIDSARNVVPEAYFAAEPLFKRCPKLLVVSTNGVGYDTVDVPACTRAGILVVNQAGANREAVAEHALGLILSVSKRIAETDRALRSGNPVDRADYMGVEVAGKTLGVVGIGNTGGRLAEICTTALRMPVLAYDPYLDADTIAARGAVKVTLDELLAHADYVSVHCPLTAETRGMIDARAYALMKPGSFFITTARGGIHDEKALYEALRDKRIAGAGLDVWEPEPPKSDHPLLGLENVVASPHTAGSTHTARENIGRGGAGQLIDTLDGKHPPRLVNPDAWPAFIEKYRTVLQREPASV